MQEISESDAGQHLDALIERIIRERSAVMLTRNGKRSAALVSMELFDELSGAAKMLAIFERPEDYAKRFEEYEPSEDDEIDVRALAETAAHPREETRRRRTDDQVIS